MENEEKLIEEITSKLSLERKTELLYGEGFWKVRGIPEYNIRPIWLSDGPHGLRKESTNIEDHKGGKSVPATCFPTASALASSWDKDIVYETAKALAFEALDQGVDVVLGPGVNIKRNPLGGRNFEYYSEDPILGGTLAGYFIKGLQDNNVGACLKHFALNNQEKNRMLVNVVADKIAINNLYLKSFKIAYDICEPYMVMCAYNKINGDYASDSEFLLKKTLKEKWNYSGVVVSDWGATNLVSSYKYGLDLDMPRLDDKKKYILRDIKKGLLKIEDIDEAFKRVLRLLLKFQNKNIKKDKLDYDKHHQLSAKISENCIVLAKNEGVLPLKRDDKKIGVIGYFAKESRYQGDGSSLVNSYKVSSFLEVLDEQKISYEFTLGYHKDGTTNEELILDAKELAKRKETLLFFVATDDKNQAEGFDRNDLCLNKDIYNLFEELQKINANIITVISCGSAVELKNIISSKGILISYLGGQNVALALKRIIYGEVSPSGHLPETWPISYIDNPMHQYFPGDRVNVFYKESIYVGYRYYDTAKKDVLFPFGHGLTYSTFSYSNLKLKQDNEGNSFLLSFNVKNTGNFKAKDVVQFYLSKVDSKLLRPLQELFDFKKIELKPNEERQSNLCLVKRN